jgi:hypothetical protein
MMTRDDIIRMAEQAGAHHLANVPGLTEFLARFAALVAASPPAPSAAPVPDDEYMIDMFSAAELRAYDYGCKESMDAFTRLLDGKGSRDGVCQPQWQALRARVWKLMDASPPAPSAAPPPAASTGEEEVTRLVRWLTAPNGKGAK